METFCAAQREGARSYLVAPGVGLIVDRPITPGAVVALIRSHKAASRTSDK